MADRNDPRERRFSRKEFVYNDPAYYRIKRSEFGHGQRENFRPRDTRNFEEDPYYQPPGTGRDYEENAGYRDSYNRLDSGETWPGAGYTTSPESYRLREKKEEGAPQAIHRGKGPRNYTRSDERILDDIHNRLSDNPYLDATEIEVEVNQGEVVLRGMVEDLDAKRLAEDICETISGVRNVENRLRVRHRHSRTRVVGNVRSHYLEQLM